MNRAGVLAGLVGLAMAALPAVARADTIADGAYLVRAADCVACHTAPGGRELAGGRAFTLPFGVLYSPNLTPDATGIAGYGDDDWVRLMHAGIGRGGRHVYPAMPYTSYTGMSRSDALAIKAYLMSLPPVHAVAPANRLRFPFDQRWGMALWNLIDNPGRRFTPDPSRPEAYNRGEYLVTVLGHCGQCHTPRGVTMGLQDGKALAGAVQAGWRAYNLSSDPVHGIGGWSDAQLVQYLSTGQAAGRGPASGPMAEVVSDSLRFMTEADIRAMVTYLRGVPAQPDGPAVVAVGAVTPAVDPLGQRLFVQACAGCHLPGGQGRQSAWAALAGSHSAADPAGTNLAQVLTVGSQIDTAQGQMFMHGFTGAYDVTERAALANYTMQQFGLRPGTIASR